MIATPFSASRSHLPPIVLPAPQIIEIAGADAIAFAQAQFSSDVRKLENGRWQWSAWLSAQGRVRAFFHLLRDDDQCLRLVLRGGSAATLRDALARYVLRSKAQLRVLQNVSAWIEWLPKTENRNSESASAQAFERVGGETRISLPGAVPRLFILDDIGSTPSAADSTETARNENALVDIDAGLVTLDTALEDKLLPAWIGLDTLGATSISKGCYPGQEIVARLHFKGGNKRHLYRIAFAAKHLPEPGMTFGDMEADTGLIVSAAWTSDERGTALAVLSEDGSKRLESFSSATITLHAIRRFENQADL